MKIGWADAWGIDSLNRFTLAAQILSPGGILFGHPKSGAREECYLIYFFKFKTSPKMHTFTDFCTFFDTLFWSILPQIALCQDMLFFSASLTGFWVGG